jgi:cytochrome c-type biogenesis protein CcmH
MTFWIIAALLTLCACLAVLAPVLRGRQPAAPDSAYDLTVYRDQLAELERDIARGVIAPDEAEQARIEIGRRILKLAGEPGAEVRNRHDRIGRLVITAAVLAIPLASWGLYSATGSPNLPAQPLHARLEASPDDSTIDELVARAEAHLAANPSDGRGWDVLAPIYFRMGRFADAKVAYRHAIRLLGATAARENGFGEAAMAEAGGLVTVEAQAAFERALVLEPDNKRAHYLLAMALAQEGKTQEAAVAWTRMLQGLPEDSPWREVVQQAIAGLRADTPQGTREADGERGPDDADVEAAALMSEEDRADMIDGMVAGLDRRLRDNPQDIDGWRRLVRSYLVLDRREEAQQALARGLAALGPGEKADDLAAYANDLGLDAEGREP